MFFFVNAVIIKPLLTTYTVLMKSNRKFEGNTNLNEQADVLESLYEEPNCIAVGFHQNSISCEQWFDYNCIHDKEHFWLFDDLKESEDTECQE